MTETLIKKDVIFFLSGVHTTEGIIQKVRNETLLKLMPRGPELDKILTITREANFRHISYLTSDKLWVNDGKRKLSLINKTGDDEYHLSGNGIGFHTVNNKGELFYIDSSSNISKLLKDLKNTRHIYTDNREQMETLVCILVFIYRRTIGRNACRD